MPDITITTNKSIKLLTANKLCLGDIVIHLEGVELYAVIGVQYPLDAICTCESNDTVYTAVSDNGLYLFAIPFNSTWTLKAVKDDLSAEASVVINTKYQCEKIELTFEKRLYNSGVIYEDYTGGLSEVGYTAGTYTIRGPLFYSDDMIQMYTASSSQCAICGTQKKIDLTDVDYIVLEVSNIEQVGNIFLICNTTKELWVSGMSAQIAITDVGTTKLDVRGLSGEYYVACALFASSSQQAKRLFFTRWIAE